MANNKMYENYLMHYRTKGSKNGYTKYPGKYIPIGEKANPRLYDARRYDPDWEQDDATSEWHLSKSANDRLWKESFAETGNMYKNFGKKAGEGLLNVFTKGAYGRSKKIGKLIANKVASESEPTVVPVYKPNNKSLAQKTNMKTAEERRISGGNTGMTRSANVKPLLSGTQAVGMKGVGAYKTYTDKKKYEEARRANQQAAEARRIKGGNPYVNQREENRKAAEQRRIAGGSGISASQRQKEAEARRIAGSSMADTDRNAQYKKKLEAANNRKNISNWYNNKTSATTTPQDRMREAEARRIKGGSQGAPTANERAAEAKRKNINDWYSGQVRGGNQSAAEARRIKGGTHGVTTTAQATAEKAESERKKKKLKGVLKALLKSKSHGISRFF